MEFFFPKYSPSVFESEKTKYVDSKNGLYVISSRLFIFHGQFSNHAKHLVRRNDY